MEAFSALCTRRGLSAPELPSDEKCISKLAELTLERPEYLIPAFASFKHLSLPIVSEWISNIASEEDLRKAFCRLSVLAPLIPFLRPLMEHLLVMQQGSSNTLASTGDANVLSGIMTLLVHDFSRFSPYFLAEDLRAAAAASVLPQVRVRALAALSLLMEASEHRFNEWVAEFCRDDILAEDFKYDVVLRQAMAAAEDLRDFDHCMQFKDVPSKLAYESPLIANVAGVFVPRLGGTDASSEGPEFIFTQSSETSLRKAARALLSDKPVLLMGERGSGKTFVAEYLHRVVRGGELVRIHLGDQTDAKSLVGTYTTGEKPGTFEWTAGALTAAVRNGSWVIIEDIDRAPNDIVAVLLPLLNNRELTIPSRNETIRAAPGFQILATIAVNVLDDSHKKVIGARAWELAELDPPSSSDLEVFARAIKPFLSPVAISMLVSTFRGVEEWQDRKRQTRKASTKDFIKLIIRIGSKYTVDDIYREAVSCFTSFLSDPWPLIEVIGDSMGIPSSQCGPLLQRYQPSLTFNDERLTIGRAEVDRRAVTSSAARNQDQELQSSSFALTQPTVRLMEEVAVCVQHAEPVLLVGETGTGKTATIQHLSKLARRKLTVINVSQQVEAGDLIGGFKPVDARQVAGSLLEEFYDLFDATFSRSKNHQFLNVLEKVIGKQQWSNVIKLLREAIKMTRTRDTHTAKRHKTEHFPVNSDWTQFSLQLDAFEERLKSVQHQAQFQFIEGLLVRAIRQGSWVLLDELNLAPADTIEGISELLSRRQITLLESSGQVVRAHPGFRLFANMNPATDVGKRDLPDGVRSQFTELWSSSPESDPEALASIISRYLPRGTDASIIHDVSCFYIESKKLSDAHKLVDGAGQRPHFSIRTLSRSLTTACAISRTYGMRRALYEAFSMCFLTLLDEPSSLTLDASLQKAMLSRLPNARSVLNQTPAKPNQGDHIQFAHWWMPCGDAAKQDVNDYILTASVEHNLLNLVRAASTRMFPILIQGPTSSGKTSMINYLAKRTGYDVVRINNHEHTDLAEYLGGYESDADGRLVFREGALVKALKEGHWLILDELNLAPTDVLEALNRLLDDNRELLVPETQEVVKPHPNFVLFATQNPPGLYAGRKVLSRAFRNRFLELHFGDIPEQELEIIIRDKTGIAPSYAAKIVESYRELARQRVQRVFEQTATLRDLFRWARRPAIGYEQLAFNGFALLGERSRTIAEKKAVQTIIEKVMKVKIDTNVEAHASEEVMASAPPSIVWTKAMRRVLALIEMALSQDEPVLLVGETGAGKTTIVQAIAEARKQSLVILNAHQNTETGDLVGSQRPVRATGSAKLFEWVDGPLVSSMKNGSIFLLDEISLADDSVLERLNSVLESDRKLFVPEIGEVNANPAFKFLATMNPGGDYGKKELSPALRNRFTEIWCSAIDNSDDLELIITSKLRKDNLDISAEEATKVIVEFSHWFGQVFGLVSLRDILSWVDFVNSVSLSRSSLAHGACMVFVDGLSVRGHYIGNQTGVQTARRRCLARLQKLLGGDNVGGSLDPDHSIVRVDSEGILKIGDFVVPVSSNGSTPTDFSLSAPTTSLNAMRVVRAMQRKPILLEGSPGAGKTSLVTALAKLCGQKLTRVNLSDQTDLSDLFGQDVPLETPGKFGWRNAPFLRAMEEGHWVLLDEMNLAPQPILEGLNACLDHRGEAYVPELDRTFKKHPNFVVFAAQNPQGQGGGRKGLPKSFINRFSVVYVDQLGLADFNLIAATTHPDVSRETRESINRFMEEVARWAEKNAPVGGPFEFNLRDTLRWLDMIAADDSKPEKPQKFFDIIVLQRFRTHADRLIVTEMFKKHLPEMEIEFCNPVDLTVNSVQIRHAKASRIWQRWHDHHQLSLLPYQFKALETGIWCVEKNWPLILTGPSGSGKSSVPRLLAQLFGAKLREFAMTPDIDSTDLLGEFDQLEYNTELQRIWAFVEAKVGIAAHINDTLLVDAVRRRDLHEVQRLINGRFPEIEEAIRTFEAQDFSKPVFRWVDGMLVKAVESGDWLVLDNANLCSAAVLDRLNSLLERNGTLLINECTQADGSPREVKPHPSFRLFLTVDPRYGELSRAMRNRGVELYILDEPDSYGISSQRSATVCGALPLQFSQPLTIARIADLQSDSWMRVLLLDEGQTPVRKLEMVSSQLSTFYSKLMGTCTTLSLVQLQELWILNELENELENALESAMENQSSTNLLEIAAVHLKRNSVDCELNVFGAISTLLPYVLGGGELASVLVDLTKIKDPSRVLVIREWLVEFARQRSLPELEEKIQMHLGKKYDFSDGGVGMEKLWKYLGKPSGFPNESTLNKYLSFHECISTFDRLAAQIDLKHSEKVAEIRGILASVTEIDETISHAVATFSDTVSQQSNSLVMANTGRMLTAEFENLWASLALVYATAPSEPTRKALVRLGAFADIPTDHLRAVLAIGKGLKVPDVLVPGKLESTVFTILQSTNLGQAKLEIDEFANFLSQNSEAVRDSMAVQRVLGQIVEQCVSTIAQSLQNADLTDELVKQIGSMSSEDAALRVAAKMLNLYVCPLPMDPAIAQHVKYERYLRVKAEHSNDRDCWEQMKIVIGSRSDEVERFLANRELRQEPIPTIWRPRESSIPIIHRDMLAASQAAQMALHPFKSSDEIDVLLKNVQSVTDRLSRAVGYRDLVLVVRTALALLKLGLSVKRNSILDRNETIESKLTSSNLWLLDPTIVGHSTPLCLDHPILTLRSLLSTKRLPLDDLHEMLMDIYRRWTLERLRVEEKAREDRAGFRYTDDEDDEVKAEREFHRLFPDYDETPDLPEQEDSFVPDLVRLYCNRFGKEGQEDVLDTILLAADRLTRAHGQTSSVHLPALYLALKRRTRGQSAKSDGLNFYTDSSPQEAELSQDFAAKVSRSVAPLLSRWPEHDTLQTLQAVSADVLGLPPYAPVALHLSKVEQMYHYLSEWDRYAAKDDKFGELSTGASSLIVHWRRMELSTWPALFAFEKAKMSAAAGPFWFHLFETLIASPSDDLTSIAKILIVFISESPVGQFEQRLLMLTAFERHLTEAGMVNVSNCVQNVRRLFQQHLPRIRKVIDQLEAQLQKKVVEVVKLASWRDVNIHALKQSAQRSHRQLFKVVKKFRELLSTKVTLEVDFVAEASKSLPVPASNTLLKSHWDQSWLQPITLTEVWISRAKPLRELETTLQMFAHYAELIQNTGKTILASGDLLSLANDVEARARQLRNETPKVWSKETKKTISSLRVEKQNLFTETLRELKKSGLSSAVNKVTVAQQSELSKVLASSPSISSSSDGLFYSMVELLPRLRSAISEATNKNGTIDVPSNDLQRGLAYVENAFSYILRLRRNVSKHLVFDEEMQEQLIGELTELAETRAELQFDRRSSEKAIGDCAHLAANVVKVVAAVETEASSQTSARLRIQEMESLIANGTQLSAINLRTSTARDWVRSLDAELNQCLTDLKILDFGGLISPLLQKLATFTQKIFDDVSVLLPAESLEATEEVVLKACRPVLVIVQEVIKFTRAIETENMRLAEVDEDGEKWFTSAVDHLERLLAMTRSKEIWKRLRAAADATLSLGALDGSLAGAEAATLLIFINGFKQVGETIRSVYQQLLASLAGGTFKLSGILLSLATEGFCSPQPTDDDAEDEEDAKGDGIGLGDGQGAQSTSKDIDEDDDDVTEAMQTSNPDQEQRDPADDREDKAQEMDGDMAGNMEEMGPDENDDEADHEDQDEDMEDELGDLDDMDPNAVDEKMWDDKAEAANEKEKQSSEGVDGKKDEDLQAGNEDEDLAQQQESSNGREGHEPEQNDADGNDATASEGEESDGELDENGQEQADREDLDADVEQKDALDLPDDMQLDSDQANDDNDENGDGDDGVDPLDADDDSELLDEKEEGEGEGAQPDQVDKSESEENDEGDSGDADAANAADATEDVASDDDAMKDDLEGKDDDRPEDEDADADDEDLGDKTSLDREDEATGQNADQNNEEKGSGADVEGLEGPEMANEVKVEDQATSTEQKTGSAGQGGSGAASEAQPDVGNSGGARFLESQPDAEQQDSQVDEQDTAVKESLKHLGDAMKEFHRRQREIQEQADRTEKPSPMDDPSKAPSSLDDVEHVGADDPFDLQALGRATKEDERQEIDESMAIDDEAADGKEREERDIAGDEMEGAEQGAGGAGQEALDDEMDDSGDSDSEPTASAGPLGPRDDESDEGDNTPPDVKALESQVDATQAAADAEETDIWNVYESKTQQLSLVLGEQLRLILEPTVASKLRGDYRTGKRLNMKRIIPYIASEFRKDKIWLRRTKPAKREYQIMLALDDSKSMGEPAVVDLAFQAIALVGKALSSIEAGQISIAKFGRHTEIVHAFEAPFTAQAGNTVFHQFSFAQDRTDMHQLLAKSLEVFSQSNSTTAAEQWKLEIVVSDGVMDDHAGLRTLVRRAYEERVMVVFVVLDALNRDTSILDMNDVRYTTDEFGNQKLQVAKYMEDFPFDHYVIVKNIKDLPAVLASVLRQYFQAADI